jgi:hypothetical protein
MNATPLPPAVRRYLEALLLNGRQPAYAFIAANGILESWGGEMDRYFKHPLHKGHPATDQIDALVGLLPLDGENASIPHLMTGTCRSVDLHLVADAGGAWMILLDSTVEVHQQQTFQQQSTCCCSKPASSACSRSSAPTTSTWRRSSTSSAWPPCASRRTGP